MEHLKKFNTQKEYEEWKDSDDYVFPNVCKVGEDVVYNNFPEPFWIEALEDILVDIRRETIDGAYTGMYSFDKINWKSITSSITLRTGEKIYIKYTASYSLTVYIITSGKHNIGGHLLSLKYGLDYLDKSFDTHYVKFKNKENIINAKELIMSTYNSFENEFEQLFQNANNLISVPKLPRHRIGYNTYTQMFENCSSIIKAPTIHNTSIQLSGDTFARMFYGCSNLSYIKCLNVFSFTSMFTDWVNGVSPTGTFIANSKRTDFTRGVNGIPEGWNLYLYDEDNDRYVVKFKVNNIPYEFYTDEPKDVTWTEFCNSEFNTNGFTHSSGAAASGYPVMYNNQYILLNGSEVKNKDKIIINASYTIGQPTTTTEE